MKFVNLKTRISNNKKIIENFSYLSILQIFSIVLPFLTYPYLFRVLGTELYGEVIYAQTIITYVSLLINFGFNVSGAKACALHRDNKEQLSKVVSGVFSGKIILWLLCILLYFPLISTFSFFSKSYWLYFISFFITFNELLFPVWFFQGIEKMKYTTIVNVIARLFFTILTFVFVSSKADFLFVPLLNGIGALIGGILSLYLVYGKENIYLTFLPKKEILKYFKDALPLFASIASVKVYLGANKLIVGSFLGMSEVAIYDVGEKISNLMKVPIQMLSQAIFPKVCREKNISFVNKILFLSLSVSIIMYFMVFIGSQTIVILLMGENNLMAMDILRILSLSVVFSSVNTFLAGGRLIPFGYNKEYMKLVFFNTLVFFTGVGILFFTKSISIYNLAIMVVIVEVFYFVLLMFYNKKLGLLRKHVK